MLQLIDISKQYKTGELVQVALNGVSFSLRDNEFVSVLGPSGSGKTTLLNVIGGLDRYDSGDLVINGVSTKQYNNKDWDTYRNHAIGFVFQNYNLISHQNILSNVELALTIGGMSVRERKKKARQALEAVGLGDQIHKKPNQLSGGQMQRVAIARALVNDPDILLADEPTGALDSETSLQIMELLKKVAADRLVVMVTHNAELAEQYSTRIIRLKDGQIVADSHPFDPEAPEETVTKQLTGDAPAAQSGTKKKKARMSFLTSLSLSANNLRSKKGRTILISLASSIGIIGIALILSISTGVNDYIYQVQKDAMTSYPITVDAQTIDLAGLMNEGMSMREQLMEAFQIGNWEDVTTLDELQRQEAQRENELNEKGEPPEINELDDDNIHVLEHTKYVYSAAYRELRVNRPDAAERIMQHVRDHKAKQQQQAAGQISAANANVEAAARQKLEMDAMTAEQTM